MTRSSTSEMRKLVTSYYESGQSQTAFARDHGISKGNPLGNLYREPHFTNWKIWQMKG